MAVADEDEGDADGGGGDPAPIAQGSPGPTGLALSALIVGISSALLAAATWAVWLSAGVPVPVPDFGWSAYTPMPAPAPASTPNPTQALAPLGGAGLLIALAAGAAWCALLPASTVGLLLARIAARHRHDRASRRYTRAATVTAVTALVLTLAGTALLCLTLYNSTGMPAIYRSAG